MATAQSITDSTEAAIIARMIHTDKADLPKDTAQAVLGARDHSRFLPVTIVRMADRRGAK